MQQQKADKRATIMRAAMELVAEQGFHGTPTSQIAERAGIGVGTIYRYFRDKDELIEEIHEEVHVLFGECFTEHYDADLSIRENYLHIFTGLTRLFIAKKYETRFMEQYYNSPYGVAKKRAKDTECDRSIHDFFETAKQQQVIKDLPLEFLVNLSLGAILFLVRDHHNGFISLDDQAITQIVEANWDGLKR